MNFDKIPPAWGSSSGFRTWATSTTSTTWGDHVEWLPARDGRWESVTATRSAPEPARGSAKVMVSVYRDPRSSGIRMLGATEPVKTAGGFSGCQLLLRANDETRVEWHPNTEECDSALLAYDSSWCSTGYEVIGTAEVRQKWVGAMDERWASSVFLTVAGNHLIGRSA